MSVIRQQLWHNLVMDTLLLNDIARSSQGVIHAQQATDALP